MTFTCKFTEDWEYTKSLYMFLRNRDRKLQYFWAIFTVLLAGATLYYAVIRPSGFGIFYAVMLCLALWRNFSGLFRVQRQWKKRHPEGETLRETVFEFGEQIQATDPAGAVDQVPWSAVSQIRREGGYLFLWGNQPQDKNGYVCVPEKGFDGGTAEDFLAWMAQEHPEIPIH